MATIFSAPRLDQLASLLNKSPSVSRSPRVIALQPKGARPALFWMDEIRSLELAKSLGHDQPFFSVILGFPGRDEPTPRFTDIAKDVATLLAYQATGPYYLGGFCTRGLLAYEVAVQLRSLGQQVDLVIMLNSDNPKYQKQFLKQQSWAKSGQPLAYHFARSGFSRPEASRVCPRLAVRENPTLPALPHYTDYVPRARRGGDAPEVGSRL